MKEQTVCAMPVKDFPENAVIDRIPAGTFENNMSGLLSGVPFAIQNNIALQGFRLTCGSRMLEHYISPYTATAVTQLMNAGAIPVCTANMAEFGVGVSASDYCTGGPAFGCAALVASSCVPLALASDTLGDARISAAYGGAFGMKPTYGAYSRFGLTARASSMEQIALIGGNLDQMRKAHFCLSSEKDPLDRMQKGLTHVSEKFSFADQKIAVLSMDGQNLHPTIEDVLKEAADLIHELGADILPCRMERPHLIAPAFCALSCAETSANMARLTGLLTGTETDAEMNWETRYSQCRSLLGKEVQMQIALGAYILCEGNYEKYYAPAQQYRDRLKEWFHQLFEDHALLLLPTVSTPFPETDKTNVDRLWQYRASVWTACANLAGLPSLSVPWGEDANGRPIAVQLIAPEGRDDRLFDAAEELMKAKERI